MNGYTPSSSVSQNYSGNPYPSQHPSSAHQGRDGKDKGATNNPRLHQNAEAVVRNIAKNKAVLREGKHAAAIDQLHENDLHGIEHFAKRPEDHQFRDPRQEYMERKGHIGLHLRPRIKQNPGYEDTELTTSFDPMRDRHLWAMWRTAVNGRIVDEVRRIERNKCVGGGQFNNNSSGKEGKHRNQYGPSIVTPPLRRFIKLQDGSKEIAQHLSKEGKGQLQTSQFVFYGLPRVYMERGPSNGGDLK
ncbi:hypothetical protein PoB_004542200 [Plakobranchus ocellatus]|uniref:Uncharacterized protein n=1 Tax=Plakobranchus ocellatus TaxID=259542 RepID=A0AAV4BJ15_9GAST|nr:hypothetical protein PoB_004542200 [Plakobranchus ocellatus]